MALKLNPEQQRAMLHVQGPLLVLAGAGSGKTRVITQKIAHLIQELQYKPTQIIAVTFTNKAAQEMKHRVQQLLPAKNTRGLMVNTFHTLGLTILRHEHKAADLAQKFSILDSSDARGLLQQIIHKEHSDDDTDLDLIQAQISRWKNQLITPSTAISQAEDAKQVSLAHIYQAYCRYSRAYHAVDFDDLILLPVQLFREHPDILTQWQGKLRYILVDEYQDTNFCQYELIKQLVGIRESFTVVVDDDQSIYAWRGASSDHLHRLQKEYPRLEVIKLEQNYRSTKRILRAANQLISVNPHVFEKVLWSDLSEGDLIRVLTFKQDQDEADNIVLDLINHRFRHQAHYKDYAILYRNNHQSRIVEQALREHGVPYRVSGGPSFFGRGEIKDIMAYCRLCINPEDNHAFLRIINTPRREIGPSTVEKLSEYAKTRQISLLSASLEMGLSQVLSEKACHQLHTFAHWLERMAQRFHGENNSIVVRDILNDIGYSDWLQETQASPKAAERCEGHLNDLIALIDKLLEKEDNASLEMIIQRLSLLDMIDRNQKEEVQDEVQLLTLHAAKGLEFPHVYLIGVEDELLPHRSSIEENRIEEERRLMYVGMTRAQRGLTLSFTQSRKRFGEILACQPSRFLQEIDAAELDWQRHDDPVDEKKNTEIGNAHLAQLQKLLGLTQPSES